MRQRPLVGQVGDEVAQEAKLHRLRQARLQFTGPAQHLGVEGVEGAEGDAQGPTLGAQALAEGGDLRLVGQNHRDRCERFGGPHPADAFQGVGSFAVAGGGKVKLGGHRSITPATDFYPTPDPRGQSNFPNPPHHQVASERKRRG